MRVLLVECYALIYKVTRSKVISYWISLAYISLLLFYTLSGLTFLTRGMLSFSGQLQHAFKFPLGIVTAPVILGVLYKFAPNVQQLGKDAKRRDGVLTILLFSLFVLILFVYVNYGETFFS